MGLGTFPTHHSPCYAVSMICRIGIVLVSSHSIPSTTSNGITAGVMIIYAATVRTPPPFAVNCSQIPFVAALHKVLAMGIFFFVPWLLISFIPPFLLI